MRVLLVDGDRDFADFVSRGLASHGHDVRVARDGRDALFLIADEPFDAVILERALPVIDGLGVLKRVRNDRRSIPVIFLTDQADLAGKIEGLDAGADDYLIKPVAIGELSARLNAIARRPAKIAEKDVLRTGTLSIDLLHRTVQRGDRMIEMPTLEFRVLAELVKNADKILTRQMLLRAVWGYDEEPAANILASHIARIRTKLNFVPHKDAITTVHGAGYVIYHDA